MTIRTQYDPPPILLRWYDWRAVDADNYEPGGLIGWGANEQEAIEDLLEQGGGIKMTKEQVPVLFEMDGEEAISAHPFCSVACRDLYVPDFPSAPGFNPGAEQFTGLVCTQCGATLLGQGDGNGN